MNLTAKRIRLAFRSPSNLLWSVRHVLRRTPLGQLDRLLLNGYSFRPSLISINITGRCNLRCEMCMQPRGQQGHDDSQTVGGQRKELTPEQWLRVIDQAASARPAFYFSGGEPLLYRGLHDILAHIKQCGLIAALVTNATALAHHAERLVSIGVDNVTVSLDGPESVHDAVRGVPGTFRRAIEGIRTLQQAKRNANSPFPAIKINCVITPQSLNTLEETASIVRDLGIKELSFQHPIFDNAENVALHNRVFQKVMEQQPNQISKSSGEFYDASFGEDQFEQLSKILHRIKSDQSSTTRILFFPPLQENDWRGYYLDFAYPFKKRCTAPWTMMRLLADGTFEPCLHYAVGNLTETPLWQLWNCASIRHFRQSLSRQGLFPACTRCCYRQY